MLHELHQCPCDACTYERGMQPGDAQRLSRLLLMVGLGLLCAALLMLHGCEVSSPAVDQAHQAEDFLSAGWTLFDWMMVTAIVLWLGWWVMWRNLK